MTEVPRTDDSPKEFIFTTQDADEPSAGRKSYDISFGEALDSN